MDKKQADKTWRDRLLGEGFLDSIYKAYEADPDKSYALVEEDHRKAVQALDGIPAREKALLEEAQGRHAENRAYAARYGFFCGLFAGLRQFFDGGETEEDSDFMELVEQGLLMAPGMERHRLYFENQGRCNAIYDEVGRALGEKPEEDLVSVACAWDERVHHAAYAGFHRGYAAGRDVIGNIADRP